jgi:hypothetical protein
MQAMPSRSSAATPTCALQYLAHTCVVPAGHFCPTETSVPKPCPAGSWSDVTGLSASEQCKECVRAQRFESGVGCGGVG